MNLFNFIKSEIQILQVISEYTTLKQAGIYWKGICPFHSEKTPSFTVSPHRNIFYCFGCHAGGDVIAFIAKIENSTQIESAKILSERYSINVPKEIDKEFNKKEISTDEKEKYFLIHKLVAQWCNDNLKKSKDALNYIKDRKFTDDSIDKFSIGYFPGGLSTIKQFLKFIASHGFLAQDLMKVSILNESKNTVYSPFEERIIFPIKDQIGRFCGFGGRIYKSNDERTKYYNSHENSFFNKGSILFGLDLAKKSIQDKNYAFLVEGYTDCIAMAQNGYNNCVAVLGTACTIDHLKLLSRFTGNIYVLYDGDQAGRNAILRLTEMCWNVNLELNIVCLGDKEDPASFLFKNGNLQKLINSSKDIYSFFIENSSNNFNTKTLNEKIWTVKKLIDIIRNIDDQLKRDILLQEIAKRLNVPFESLKNNHKSDITTKAKFATKKELIEDKENINNEDTQISNLEKRLFSIIMNNFNLLIPSNYYISEFFTSPAKEILNFLIELKNNDRLEVNFNDLWSQINEDHRNFINKTLLEDTEDLSKNFSSMILQLQKKNWKRIAHRTKLKLIEAQRDSDHAMANKIITEFQELKKKLINGDCDA